MNTVTLSVASHDDGPGARWPPLVGRRKEPNLLNVAVTRAKEAVYVVGNRSLWRSAGVFSDLDAVLN